MSKEQIKRKLSKTKQTIDVVPKKTKNHESINWLEFLAPKTSAELLIHPKKLDDIKKWFQLTQENNRILLLIGPPGSSKLTAIKVIAKELNYNVSEWSAKQDVDRDLLMDDGDFSYNHKKQSDSFKEFLLKSSRYNSIFSQQKDRLLVVKDFPSIFLRKGNEDMFWNQLKRFKATSSSPLIFILTETNSKTLNIEYNLFPEAVRIQLAIDTININPISLTNMKKALKQICPIMKAHETEENQFLEPTQSVIDDICAQSQGDIRNAIMNMQMVCQKGTKRLEITTKSKAKGKTGKMSKVAKDKITKGVGRDENLGIFHAVGRALFPKSEENPETKKMRLTHSPEVLADIFSSQPSNYIELLHSNYLKNFNAIDDVRSFTDFMSHSDVFQTEYRSAQKMHILSLNLVIRAAMVCNTDVSKGFRPISCYASKKFKNLEEKCLQEYFVQATKYNDGHRISVKDYFLDYASLIKSAKPL